MPTFLPQSPLPFAPSRPLCFPPLSRQKNWFGEAFEDLWKFTFGDGKHEKTWADVREEDKKIFHEVG